VEKKRLDKRVKGISPKAQKKDLKRPPAFTG
ncbi:unnamed protein product, partial [marine sediment metagenome]